MTPTVSILIPAFNANPWIEQAVESALTQGPDVEVIVVDDGSTDGTVEKLRAFDGKIKWETGPNQGAPAARNRLLHLARAPWVQYLDADDYLLPGKVSSQLAYLESIKPKTVDVLYGPANVEWHEDGWQQDGVRQSLLEIPEPHDPWMLLALWHLPQTGAPLWSKQALLDVGGWREEQPCCQEHELYFRLLKAGKSFVYSDLGGAVYRRFADGTLSTKNIMKVREERAKIEAELEAHLSAIGELTPERLWAIDQARFEIARSAWPCDRNMARELHRSISSQNFRPDGDAAPSYYRLIYRYLGFELSENIAAIKRWAVSAVLQNKIKDK